MLFPLIAIFLTTLAAIGALIFIIQFTAPIKPDGSLITVNLIYFFVLAFISLAGIVTLVLYWLGNIGEKRLRKTEVQAIHRPKLILKKSLRRGFLFALALVGIGVLNSLKFSNPLNIILLISAIAIIEVYFFGH